MTARDGTYLNTNTACYGGLVAKDFRANGSLIKMSLPSISTNYFKMIGKASGIWVSWIANGQPDFTGSSYAGPGVLDLLTISVSN